MLLLHVIYGEFYGWVSQYGHLCVASAVCGTSHHDQIEKTMIALSLSCFHTCLHGEKEVYQPSLVQHARSMIDM